MVGVPPETLKPALASSDQQTLTIALTEKQRWSGSSRPIPAHRKTARRFAGPFRLQALRSQ
jgi:hypothetical protein